LFRLHAIRLDYREEGPTAKYLGRSQRAGQYYSAARIFVLWFPVRECRCFFRAQPFFCIAPKWNYTTTYRHFGHGATIFCAFTSIFRLTEISRLFTLQPQIRETVIRRADGPFTPGIPQRRLTQPAGLNRDIEGGSSIPRRRRSQRCRRGIAQICRRSEWLPGCARGAVFVFRSFEIPGESNLAAAC